MAEQNSDWIVVGQKLVDIENVFPEENKIIRERAYLKVVKNKKTGFLLVALQKKGQAFRFPYKYLVPITEALIGLQNIQEPKPEDVQTELK
jgi:hypothetical protein